MDRNYFRVWIYCDGNLRVVFKHRLKRATTTNKTEIKPARGIPFSINKNAYFVPPTFVLIRYFSGAILWVTRAPPHIRRSSSARTVINIGEEFQYYTFSVSNEHLRMPQALFGTFVSIRIQDDAFTRMFGIFGVQKGNAVRNIYILFRAAFINKI